MKEFIVPAIELHFVAVSKHGGAKSNIYTVIHTVYK